MEKEKRYVDAESLVVKLGEIGKMNGRTQINTTLQAAMDLVKKLPSENVRIIRNAGKNMSAKDGLPIFTCSICNGEVDMTDKFCKHCGVDFRPQDSLQFSS